MAKNRISPRLREVLPLVAPGTELREGLARVMKARSGGLVVLGYSEEVRALCNDGFELDVPFSATRLRELCKMDGAVLLELPDLRIRRANVQLIPDPSISTRETGMRHRTANRMAVQTGVPVIAVSHALRTITLYLDKIQYVLEDTSVLVTRANQAIATLERYRNRFNDVSATLSALEVDDLVTARDVALSLQCAELVRRVAAEVADYVVELGSDGRLAAMQMEELRRGMAVSRSLLIRDYLPDDFTEEQVEGRLLGLDDDEVLELGLVARIMGVSGAGSEILEQPLNPRGIRMLARIPRLPASVVEAVTRRWGTLSALLEVSTEELQQVEGVGPQRAQIIHDGLEQVVESSVISRLR